VHTSEATKAYLATVPGRFEFVFTPKHGSWLNMVEGFFSKMTKQMLRGIRVKTKQELADDFICPICKHPKADFEKIVR